VQVIVVAVIIIIIIVIIIHIGVVVADTSVELVWVRLHVRLVLHSFKRRRGYKDSGQ